MLKIRCEKNGNVKVYYLEGEIDTPRAKYLSEEIDVSGCDEIVFDMEKLEYTTSSGIRVLMETNLIMKEKGGRISVRNVNTYVDEIFDLTGFYTVIA